MADMVVLDQVSKTYSLGKHRVVTAIADVDLAIQEGEFVVVTGRSGSGKTTLLNLIAGLTRPTSGQVRVGSVAIWDLPDAEQSRFRNRHLGFVFQFPSLLPTLTALENVLLPTAFDSTDADPGAAETKARELLEEVGLGEKMQAYPRQLSAGQQQRVVIARALINDPVLLLADEPTSDLDEQTEQEIMSLFRGIHQRRGITVVLVTHSTRLGSFGTRSVRVAQGSIVAQGEADPLQAAASATAG